MKTKIVTFLLFFIGLNLFWSCEDECDYSATIRTVRITELDHHFFTTNSLNLEVKNEDTLNLSSINELRYFIRLNYETMKIEPLAVKTLRNSGLSFSAIACEPSIIEYIVSNPIQNISVQTMHDLNDDIRANDTINKFLIQYIYSDTINLRSMNLNPGQYFENVFQGVSFMVSDSIIQPNKAYQFKTTVVFSDTTMTTESSSFFVKP